MATKIQLFDLYEGDHRRRQKSMAYSLFMLIQMRPKEDEVNNDFKRVQKH